MRSIRGLQAAQDRFSVDPSAVEVSNGEVATVVFAIGDALGDAPGAVLKCTWYSASSVRSCAPPRISTRSRSCRRRVPTRRSQVAFMRGAWTAVRGVLVTGGLENGVERGREVRSAVTDEELDVLEPVVEGQGEVAGLLHRPLAGGVGGDSAQMHPAGAMLDEYQDVQSSQQHSVHVQEVDRDDPGGLGVQDLPPARARAARRRIDACGPQDLPDGGRRDRHAEFHRFAVDPAVPPQRILLRQANDEPGDAPDRGRAAGLASLARVILLRGQPAVPGEERRRCHREDFGPAVTRYEPGQRGEPEPGRPARNVPGWRGGAAPRSRAGGPAVRHPSPGPCGTPGRLGRVSGELAGRRS